jgi:hypothetical protein
MASNQLVSGRLLGLPAELRLEIFEKYLEGAQLKLAGVPVAPGPGMGFIFQFLRLSDCSEKHPRPLLLQDANQQLRDEFLVFVGKQVPLNITLFDTSVAISLKWPALRHPALLESLRRVDLTMYESPEEFTDSFVPKGSTIRRGESFFKDIIDYLPALKELRVIIKTDSPALMQFHPGSDAEADAKLGCVARRFRRVGRDLIGDANKVFGAPEARNFKLTIDFKIFVTMVAPHRRDQPYPGEPDFDNAACFVSCIFASVEHRLKNTDFIRMPATMRHATTQARSISGTTMTPKTRVTGPERGNTTCHRWCVRGRLARGNCLKGNLVRGWLLS